MPEAQLPNPRKRRYSEQPTLQQNNASQHLCKRRTKSHPSGSQFPPAFWDNLSKIDLTRRALKELDLRNTQAILNSRQFYLCPYRGVTRRVFAELKNSLQSLEPPAEYLCDCGTSDLKNIKQIARHGGPDLSDLRGLPKPSSSLRSAMSSTPSNSRAQKQTSKSTSRNGPSTNTPNTVSTGPYNRNFQQNLIDGGVYPDGYEHPDGRALALPANWEEINRRLTQPRRSLSPSRFTDDDFRKFKRADTHASKEKQVTTSVIPIIEGYIRDARCVSGGIPFTNLNDLTDGTLVPGNPDIYYGARPEQLDRRVRDELSGHIIPSTQDDLPIVPNFFLTVKGPAGSLAVAGRQASYDGSLGARGMHSLQSYRQQEPGFVNTASTISSIYHGGQLKMYTIHLSQPTSSAGQFEYCMHQLKGWSLTSDPETFRQGVTSYRNARDWAKEQRDEAIRRANEKVDEDHANYVRASSFTSEVTSDGTYTIEMLTEGSHTSRTEESNTNIQKSDVSSDQPSVDPRASVNRKRRNAGDSD